MPRLGPLLTAVMAVLAAITAVLVVMLAARVARDELVRPDTAGAFLIAERYAVNASPLTTSGTFAVTDARALLAKGLREGWVGGSLPGAQGAPGTAAIGGMTLGYVRMAAPLAAGRLPTEPTEVLAVLGGPYRLGDTLPERSGRVRVTGFLRAPAWAMFNDGTVFRLAPSLDPLTVNEVIVRPPRGIEAQRAADEVAFALRFSSGRPLMAVPAGLDAMLLNAAGARVYALSQVRPLTLLAIVTALVGVMSQVAAAWRRGEGEHRLWRVLGLSRARTAWAWVRQAVAGWAAPAGAAVLTSVILGAAWRLPPTPGLEVAGVTAAAGLGLSLLLAYRASSVPLTRAERLAAGHWAPLAMFLTVTVAWLGAPSIGGLLVARTANLGVAASIGRLVSVKGVPTRPTPLIAGDCVTMRRVPGVIACAAFRSSRWTPTVDDQGAPGLGLISVFDPRDAGMLGVTLIAGRWPQRDGEIVLDEQAGTFRLGQRFEPAPHSGAAAPSWVVVGLARGPRYSRAFEPGAYLVPGDSLAKAGLVRLEPDLTGLALQSTGWTPALAEGIHARLPLVSVTWPARAQVQAAEQANLIATVLLVVLACIVTGAVSAMLAEARASLSALWPELAVKRALGATTSGLSRQEGRRLAGQLLAAGGVAALAALVYPARATYRFSAASGALSALAAALLMAGLAYATTRALSNRRLGVWPADLYRKANRD